MKSNSSVDFGIYKFLLQSLKFMVQGFIKFDPLQI